MSRTAWEASSISVWLSHFRGWPTAPPPVSTATTPATPAPAPTIMRCWKFIEKSLNPIYLSSVCHVSATLTSTPAPLSASIVITNISSLRYGEYFAVNRFCTPVHYSTVSTGVQIRAKKTVLSRKWKVRKSFYFCNAKIEPFWSIILVLQNIYPHPQVVGSSNWSYLLTLGFIINAALVVCLIIYILRRRRNKAG